MRRMSWFMVDHSQYSDSTLTGRVITDKAATNNNHNYVFGRHKVQIILQTSFVVYENSFSG